MANTTADKLAMAIASKEEIKTAIVDMGGEFQSEADKDKLSAFGEAIRSIPTGGADMVESLDAATPGNIKPGFLRIVKAEMKDADGNAVQKDGVTLYTYSLYIWQIDESYPQGHFVAAHGAYDAKSVYFSDNLMTTTNIGNITTSNGQATISAKGKNLEEVFTTIFVKEDTSGLKKTNPSVSSNISSPTWVQIGSGEASQDVTITFKDGAYKYGPNPPGCAATAYYFDGVESKTAEGEMLATKTIAGDFSEKKYTSVKIKASYSAATQSPKSNTGNVYDGQKFAASTTSEATVNVYGCYVPLYYGFKTPAAALSAPGSITATEIQALGNTISNKTAYDGSIGKDSADGKTTYAFKEALKAPEAFQQLFYAVPTCFTKQLTKIMDSNNLPLTVQTTGTVEVTLGTAKQNYKVYYVALDAAYNTLDLTLTWA
jgi:hypothetical protein